MAAGTLSDGLSTQAQEIIMAYSLTNKNLIKAQKVNDTVKVICLVPLDSSIGIIVKVPHSSVHASPTQYYEVLVPLPP